MDNKNVFIAIALSMSVLLFWAAFFESPRPVNNNTIQKQKKTTENVITPNINESLKVDAISREDSIKNSERIKIENDSVVGSMLLEGGLLDDISFKKHKQNLNLFYYRLENLYKSVSYKKKTDPVINPKTGEPFRKQKEEDNKDTKSKTTKATKAKTNKGKKKNVKKK